MTRPPISYILAASVIAVTSHTDAANAQTPSPQVVVRPAPIAIKYVRVADQKAEEGRRGTIYLAYENVAPVAADDVRFTVHHGQAIAHVDDKGLFSPNVRIDHRFAGGPALRSSPSASSNAVAVYVHFIDGPVWTSADAAQ